MLLWRGGEVTEQEHLGKTYNYHHLERVQWNTKRWPQRRRRGKRRRMSRKGGSIASDERWLTALGPLAGCSRQPVHTEDSGSDSSSGSRWVSHTAACQAHRWEHQRVTLQFLDCGNLLRLTHCRSESPSKALIVDFPLQKGGCRPFSFLQTKKQIRQIHAMERNAIHFWIPQRFHINNNIARACCCIYWSLAPGRLWLTMYEEVGRCR